MAKFVKRGNKIAQFASREELEHQREKDRRRMQGYDPIKISEVDYDGESITDSSGKYVGRFDTDGYLDVDDEYREYLSSFNIEEAEDFLKPLINDYISENLEEYEENAGEGLTKYIKQETPSFQNYYTISSELESLNETYYSPGDEEERIDSLKSAVHLVTEHPDKVDLSSLGESFRDAILDRVRQTHGDDFVEEHDLE